MRLRRLILNCVSAAFCFVGGFIWAKSKGLAIAIFLVGVAWAWWSEFFLRPRERATR